MPHLLQAKLDAARQRLMALRTTRGLLISAGFLALICLLGYWSDRAFVLTQTGRLGWLIAIMLSLVGFLALLVVRPARNKVSDSVVALEVERTFPDLNERLITLVTVSPTGAATVTQKGMLGQLSVETERIASSLNFVHAFPLSALRKPAMTAVIGVGLFTIQTALAPAAVGTWVKRILFPGADIAVYSYTKVQALADTVSPRGEDASVSVIVSGRLTDHAKLRVKSGSGEWSTISLDKGTEVGDTREFKVTLPQVKENVQYFAIAGDGQSNPHTLRVEDRPRISRLKLNLHYPAYMSRPDDAMEATSGNIAAPAGTQIKMEAIANKPLATATYNEEKMAARNLPVHGDTASTYFEVSRDKGYSFGLKDLNGFEGVNAPTYSIHVQPDLAPTIRLEKPNADIERAPSGLVDLMAVAEDDFGVAQLRFAYSGSATGTWNVPINVSKSVRAGGMWSLDRLHLKGGETIRVEAVAADNDTVAGPHTVHSNAINIHVISAAEMAQKIAAAKELETEALKQLAAHQREARQLLQDAMKTNSPEKMATAEQAERALAMEAADLNQKMAQNTQQMKDNNLNLPTEMARREDAQKQMDELSKKEIPAAAEKVRAGAKSDAAKQEDEIQKKLDELANQGPAAPTAEQLSDEASKLSREQQAIADKAAALEAAKQARADQQATPAEKQAMKDLAAKQAALAQKTQQMEKSLKSAVKDAKERNDPAAAKMEKAQQNFQKSNASSKQAKAAQDLQKNDPSSAAKQGSEASESLDQLSDELNKAANGEKDNASKDQAEKMETLADKLMELANRQSTIARDIANNPGKETSDALSAKEKAIKDEASKVAAEFQRDDILPSAQQNLKRADELLKDTSDNLDKYASKPASYLAKDATKQLMQAAQDAQASAAAMQKAQESKAMQQELQKMAREQRQVNKDTSASESLKGSEQQGEHEKEVRALSQKQSGLLDKANRSQQEMPSDSFRWAMKQVADRMQGADTGLRTGNTGADTQRQQTNAAQMLERMARTMGKEAAAQQQQAQNGGKPNDSDNQNAQAAAELQLAREMEAQLRQETGSLDERRKQNPNNQMTAQQQRELDRLSRGQRENQQAVQRLSKQMKNDPNLGQQVQKASDAMDDIHELLERSKETGQLTQKKEDDVVSMLDKAAAQADKQNKQQQQMAQKGKPGGSQQANAQGQQPGGNKPPQKGFAPIVAAQDSIKHNNSQYGKGFRGLSDRAQQSMKEGQQEKAPAEYRDLINQYYKALSEKAK